ncbi:MAG: 3-deoxy-D-manno-octulosonic acid transferase [Candidatus Omnitrophica bacterium]|nr:3-deoxy-D-manno-octulosonic acid transferase [Candidatus Omnitrophota bacterium]
MRILFDIIYLLLSIAYLPSLLLTGKHRAGLRERCGIYPPAVLASLNNKRPLLWLHAVSVGEMKAAAPLLERIRRDFPQYRLLLSTITPTGNAVARQLAHPDDVVVFFPFDLSFVVRRVLSLFRPRLFLIMETELWPNMIAEAGRRNIPMAIINGRISDKAFPRYRGLKRIFYPVVRAINLLCVQSDTDARRMISLGADSSRVRVVGNIKFDQVKAVSDKKIPELGLGQKEVVIVAGSTHSPEEDLIMDVFCALHASHPEIRLVLAPRHPHRAGDIARSAEARGLPVCLISALNRGNASVPPGCVFILDVMGVLQQLYCRADIVFVGGSLIPHGGQNPIEPAACAKPVIFGPHMFNFSEIAALFLRNNAAVQVQDKNGLQRAIEDLLQDAQKREQLSLQAKKLVQENQGSVNRIMDILGKLKFLPLP